MVKVSSSRKRRRASLEKYLAHLRPGLTISLRPGHNGDLRPNIGYTAISSGTTYLAAANGSRPALNAPALFEQRLTNRTPVGRARTYALLAHQDCSTTASTRFSAPAINI